MNAGRRWLAIWVTVVMCMFFTVVQAMENEKNIKMSSNPPPSKPMSVDALMKSARGYIGGKLPTETHQSLPIPLRIQGRLVAGFLLCTSVVRPMEGVWLFAPNHHLYLDVMTGEAVLMQPVNPADFNVGVEKGQNLGRYNMLAGGRTPEEFMALQRRLYHAYDQLWEPFGRGQIELSEQARAAVIEFKEVFPLIAEEPLIPFYRVLGRDFFQWLDNATK